LFGQLAAKAAEQPSDVLLHQIAAHCLIWQATFARLFVSNDDGLIAIEQALCLIGRVPARLAAPEHAFALLELGRRQIDIRAAESVPLLEQSAELYQQAGDPYGVAEARYQLGSTVERLGDYAEAEERVRASLAIFTAQGDDHGIAQVYRSLGRIAQDSGRLDESEQWRMLAADRFRKLGDSYLLVYALTDIGFARIHAGRFDDAIPPLQEAITLGEQNGFRRASAWAADNLEYR
jgi:tetratricopeptide (TPR) repeat protein